MPIKGRTQFWSGLIFLCIGVVALWQLPAKIGTATTMGPGYFPMLLGFGLVLLGATAMLLGINAGEPTTVGALPLKPAFFVLIGILVFAVLLTRAGLAVSLLCLVVASCYDRLRSAWLSVLVTYLVLLAMAWLIFIYAIQLPIELL